jgi:exopolyphosphatase/guanosine-5'-triphosphate,3'-diphosphate pyrophosphatase
VLLGWPGAEGLVCDIGGSSMELAELLGGGEVGLRRTSDLGPLKLMGLKGGKKEMRAHIKARVAELAEAFPTGPTACSSSAGRGAPSPGSTWSGAPTR